MKTLFVIISILVTQISHARCYVGHGNWEPGPCEKLTLSIPENSNLYEYLKRNITEGFAGTRCKRPDSKIGMINCCEYINGAIQSCYTK